MVDSSVPLFQFQVGNLEERIPCKLFWRCRFQPFPVSVNLGWSIAVPQKNRRGMAYHSHSDMMFDVWLKQSCLGHYMLINTYKHIRAHLWRGFRLVHPCIGNQDQRSGLTLATAGCVEDCRWGCRCSRGMSTCGWDIFVCQHTYDFTCWNVGTTAILCYFNVNSRVLMGLNP